MSSEQVILGAALGSFPEEYSGNLMLALGQNYVKGKISDLGQTLVQTDYSLTDNLLVLGYLIFEKISRINKNSN